MAELQSYSWAGISKNGKRNTGVLQAADAKTAQLELQKMGIEVINIKEKESDFFSLKVNRKKKVKTKDILLFTRFLSTMLAAGLPLLQSIDVIQRDQHNATMRSMLLDIRSNISSGKTLTESFRKYPQHFGNLYCSLINTGEKSGTLGKILSRLANYMEKMDTIKRKIKKALIYPTVIMIVAIAVSSLLLVFVVPQFESIFKSFGAQLPYFTRLIVGLSSGLRNYWWIVLSIVTFGFVAFKYSVKNNEAFAERVDRAKLKIPVFGELIKKGVIARFTRTLSITMEAGMPIVDAMKSLADIMENKAYRKAILQISTDLVNGHQLNVAVNSTNMFPVMAVQMIAVGEASGSLSEMLNKIADYYEEDLTHMVDNLSSLLEPFIMILLGVIIGGFVVAMYLPIFKIGSIVH